MAKIIDMRMRRGRPERFVITLNDEQEVILTPEIILKYNISPQKNFSDEEFVKILKEDNICQAKDQGMRYLAIRPHSRFELVRKMKEKGYRSDVIDFALADLEKIDLINDEDFSRLFIQNELRLHPVGKLLLSKKLAARGVHRDIFEPLIKELYPDELENEIARELAQKFIRNNSLLQERKLKEKLVRFMQGKGFNWEKINMVLNSGD
jgi:regulatory protein